MSTTTGPPTTGPPTTGPPTTGRPATGRPAVGPPALLAAVVTVLSAVPAWQFAHWQWIAFSIAAPAVLGLGAPVHRAAGAALRQGRIGVDVLVAAGPPAALGWSAYALLAGGAGDPGFTQSLTDRTLALDAAVTLTVLALAGLPGRAGADRPGPGALVLVPGTAVAVLGLGLGAGAGTGAVAGAVAVLVAGCPCAVWIAARWAGAPSAAGWTVRGDDPDVLRFAAALAAPHPDDPLARAVTAAAGEAAAKRDAAEGDAAEGDAAEGDAAEGNAMGLPGVSDADGDPTTGLRGIVSEMRGADHVVAHAVLVGPAEWIAAHGVTPPDGTGPLLVAWDGEPRGRLEAVRTPPREPWSGRAGRYVAVLGALAGAALAAAGTLGPATAVLVPLTASVVAASVVAAPSVGVAAIRAARRHPIGATAG